MWHVSIDPAPCQPTQIGSQQLHAACACCSQVVSGQALQSLCQANRGGGGGCLSLTAWILIFSASQLLLCLLPDINSLTAVTAVGAATTLGFSVLATVGSAIQGGWADRWAAL